VTGLSVDPSAYAVGAHNLASIARQVQAEVDRRVDRLQSSMAGLRQVEIASRDPTLATCEVYLDGDTTLPLPCALAGSHTVPIVGRQGWVLQSGTDLVLVGMRDAGLPKARLRSTSTASSVSTEVDWDFAVGSVQYDTDWDGTTGMFNEGGGNLVVRWPGVYTYGARTFATPSAGGVQPIMLLQELGGGAYYDADQDTSVGTNGIHLRAANERFFNAGQGIQLRVRSAGGSSTFGDGDTTNELGTVMWLSYKP
jgi:hypothetical protein